MLRNSLAVFSPRSHIRLVWSAPRSNKTSNYRLNGLILNQNQQLPECTCISTRSMSTWNVGSKIASWHSKILRTFSGASDASNNNQPTEGEIQLKSTILKCFPNATKAIVEDQSGGCGSMYSVYIESPDFEGLSTVKQHMMVNNALKQEIKSMHGIRIQTAAPKSSK